MIVYDMICCCMYPAPRPPPDRYPPDRLPPHPNPRAHLHAHSPLSTSDDDDDGKWKAEGREKYSGDISDEGYSGLADHILEILQQIFSEGEFKFANFSSQIWKIQSSFTLKLRAFPSWGISCHGRVNIGRKWYFHEGGGSCLRVAPGTTIPPT